MSRTFIISLICLALIAYGFVVFSVYKETEQSKEETNSISAQLKENIELMQEKDEAAQKNLRDIHDSLVISLPEYREIFDKAFYPAPTSQPVTQPTTQSISSPAN